MFLNWKVDQEAAAEIQRDGMSWSSKLIKSSSVDEIRSRANHARSEALNKEAVDDYAAAMSDGAVFPMIVVARIDGSNKYVIAGGNHRFAAAKLLGVTEFECMVVECDAVQFDLLCPRLNLYVGQRESRKNRAEAAADRVVRLGITTESAAKQFGVAESAVRSTLSVRRAEIAAAKIGVSTHGISASVLARTASVSADSALFPVVLQIAKTKINEKEMLSLISEVRKLPNEAAKVAKLTEQLSARQRITAHGRRAKLQVRAILMRCVSSIQNKVTDGVTLCQLQLDRSEAIAMAEALKKAAETLVEAASNQSIT